MANVNYRVVTNPDYLGAYSLDDGNEGYFEVNGTILSVEKKWITDQSGKAEKLVGKTSLGKPIILRSTNAKVLQEISGTRYFNKWVNVPVVFYVDQNVKSPQGKVHAIRLRRQANAAPVDYTPAINSVKACTSLADMKAVFEGLTANEKVACEAVKNELKLTLK